MSFQKRLKLTAPDGRSREETADQRFEHLTFERHQLAVADQRILAKFAPAFLKAGGLHQLPGFRAARQFGHLVQIKIKLIPKQAANRRIGTGFARLIQKGR